MGIIDKLIDRKYGFGEYAPKADPMTAPKTKKNTYDFIVKSDSDESDKELDAYQKFWTDKEDRYEGYTLREFKANAYIGDKVYKYPPLDVTVRLEAFIAEEDGAVTITAYLLDGEKEIRIGTAAKTKAKKILRILQQNNPKISAELYGGNYWKMEGSGYVEDAWDEVLTVRVYFEWQ